MNDERIPFAAGGGKEQEGAESRLQNNDRISTQNERRQAAAKSIASAGF